MRLTLTPIDAAEFAPFGSVIEAGPAFARSDHVAEIANGRPRARANLATIRLKPTPLPTTIVQMERHPFSTQAFMPLDLSRYVVVVAPDSGGAPDMANARGFVVMMGTGISYANAVWHANMMVIDRAGSMAILVHEDGTSDDCTFVTIPAVTIDL